MPAPQRKITSPSVDVSRPSANRGYHTAPAYGGRPKSRVPLITVATIGILLVAFFAKVLLTFVATHAVYFERERLKERTQEIANSLDVTQIKALTGQPSDESSPAFKALLAPLIAIRNAHPEVHFNYLMGWNGRAVVFLLDSTDPNSTDYSPPGQVYEEASPELVRSFTTGEPFVEGPSTDRWGTWVSGLAPIKDSAGRVVAVMGMDVDATRWNITLGVSRVVAYLIIGLLLGLVFFFARRVQSLR